MPAGNFAMTPLNTALQTGFHSMAEVLLKAGVSQKEKNRALWKALFNRRLDMVELLIRFGADPEIVTFRELMWTRNPEIIRWFIENCRVDLEEGFPIARALEGKHREFLGIYMSLRDRVPSARRQASMALRIHCREGDLKWVSLLLWAGADARERVPDLDHPDDEESIGTALEEAVQYSRVDILQKLKLDPKIDDVSGLLSQCWVCRNEKVVQMLLDAGANPNNGTGHENVMERLIGNLTWSLSGDTWSYPERAVRCLELAAGAGGRWHPSDEDSFRFLRQAIAKARSHFMVEYLKRLIESHAIDRDVFQKLMDTPRMKKFLHSGEMGSVALKRFAGYNLDSRGRPLVGRKSAGSG